MDMDSASELDITLQSLMTSHRDIVNAMFPKPESKPGPRGEPKRLVKTMDFDVESTDYTVAEFYERFGKALPRLVMVTEGFFGDIIEDTFDRTMIIRIQTVSKQRRVVARADMGDHSKLISIPITYPEKVCVVKKNTLSTEQTIKAVLDGNSLPCHVQFPKDRTISVGGQTISTNHIPKLQLQKAFDEVYLLGNFIVDGVMGLDIVNVPLYLSQLRMAIVKGLKDTPPQKWPGYLEELARFSSYLKYDKEYGNQGIAQYDPSAVHSDAVYSYVEPRLYSNFASVFQHRRGNPIDNFVDYSIDNSTYQPTDKKEHENINYEEIGMERESELYNEITDNTKSSTATFCTGLNQAPYTPFKSVPEVQPMKTPPAPQVSRQKPYPVSSASTVSFVLSHRGQSPSDVGNAAFKQVQNSPVSARTGFDPPPVPNKPQRIAPTIPEIQGDPKLPARQPRPPSQMLSPTEDKKVIYTNDLPRSSIYPIRQESKDAIRRQQGRMFNRTQPLISVDTPDTTAQVAEHVPLGSDSIDVVKLSINDICDYLKVLRLDKYEPMFRENMIDGELLVDLSKEDYEQEFGMTGLEAMRILKFAKKGHLPR
ncbi:uncharacterized protein LOC127858218 [Dreissena polymorpha]|uniref:SAM domain-containing protein n=1 Tax=Dreissena polymorpha TaxID=45954 RepID=A0A9D3Z299_DREPO|nr:uncharacterized protein LOC127858218 [Dreissena polymorpha]KAH3711600.1 hypothetical protein DPMN_071271 [Dreissena polymorpha]